MKHILKILLTASFLAVSANCAPPAADGPGAGFRYSTYGSPDNQGMDYWASVGERMASKFEGAHPEAIWIVGNVYGEGTYLSFHEESSDPLIYSGTRT